MTTITDPWQVMADVMSELLRGGQTADIRCRAALTVLNDAGITMTGYGKTADAIANEVRADDAKSAEIERLTREREQDGELLRKAADALWNCAKAAITVQHSLDTPYPDDPRWSPWTRWVERPAREAHDLKVVIRKHLADTGRNQA